MPLSGRSVRVMGSLAWNLSLEAEDEDRLGFIPLLLSLFRFCFYWPIAFFPVFTFFNSFAAVFRLIMRSSEAVFIWGL